MDKYRQDIVAGVQGVVSGGEKAWQEHYSWIEEEMRKRSEGLHAEHQEQVKNTQVTIS